MAYSGPSEWSFRRLILHYARLGQMAGGVDYLVIGSELRGITTVRASASDYPAVTALRVLAGDVRTIVGGGTDILYAADWSEYFGHQPTDGSGDVYFHFDPLWADTAIDAVGIDWYPPLTDWRDGSDHLDAACASRVYDPDYLRTGVTTGEGVDWYYASTNDRHAQIRTPITDGAYGKPWVFQPKNLKSWWSNQHYNRPAGVEAASPTAWVPGMKPVRMIELGVPAVNKGGNAPNLFTDPKSTESAWPPYSTGGRDDLMQRRALEALLSAWADAVNNPTSAVYGGPMLPSDGITLWAWDARPFPDFPSRSGVWADAQAWVSGHWLNGRAAQVPLVDVIAAICQRGGVPIPDMSGVDGLVTGYVLDRPMSTRAALDPLMAAYGVQAAETASGVRLLPAHGPIVAALSGDDLAMVTQTDKGAGYSRRIVRNTRLRLRALDVFADYRPFVRSHGTPDTVRDVEVPLVLDSVLAEDILANLQALHDSPVTMINLALSPRHMGLEVGDHVTFDDGAQVHRLRIVSCRDDHLRHVQLQPVADPLPQVARPLLASPLGLAAAGADPVMQVLDLPPLDVRSDHAAPRCAVFAQPWSQATLSAGPASDALIEQATMTRAATMGELVWALHPGPTSRWDQANVMRVRLYGGSLNSLGALAVLNGGNMLAICHGDGACEILQYQTATMVGVREYELSGLLRGLGGTEHVTAAIADAGSRVVVLDDVVAPVTLGSDAQGLPYVFQVHLALGGSAAVTAAWHNRWQVPLSPVHLRARWDGGDVVFTWVRRGRLNADSWVGEVPLSEDSESYQLEILDGLSVVRAFACSIATARWTAGQIAADCPSGLPAPVTVRVCQLSGTLTESAEKASVFWL